MAEEKLLPQSIEAEQATLGSLLLGGPDVFWPVYGTLGLTGEMFYREEHGLVYEHIARLVRTDGKLDVLTLGESLGDRLKEAGGVSYLTSLVNATPTALHAEHYARIVADAYMLRRVIQAGQKIAELPYDGHEKVDDVVADMRRIVNEVQYQDSAKLIMDSRESLRGYLDLLEERAEAMERDDYKKITFPWRDIQRLVRRVEPGTLTAVAAAPGVGKTAFMEQWAEHLAQDGFKVAFFHLELSNQVMRDRFVMRQTGIDFRDLREPLNRQEDIFAKVTQALATTYDWPGNIRLIQATGWTTSRIASEIQNAHAQGLCDIAFIDYMQLIRFADISNTATVDAELNDIKNVAGKLDIPIVMASQFTKAERKERVKTLTGIKFTGGLEEKCNLGFTLSRERLESDRYFESLGHFKEGDKSPVTTARVDKFTFGPSGEVTLMFVKERLAFADTNIQDEE